MRRSKAQIYLHFVWATSRRKMLLAPEIEQAVYHCIQQTVQENDATVLALNGMPDHVHLLVQMPTTISPASLMQKVKGISSQFANKHLEMPERLQWQENYAVFSVSRSHLPMVRNYVRNQKRHHRTGKLMKSLEEVDEEMPPIDKADGVNSTGTAGH